MWKGEWVYWAGSRVGSEGRVPSGSPRDPTTHFAAQARLHSAVVEMVAVLLWAALHLQGQCPGWPTGIGLPGFILGVVEVVAVLLRFHLGLAGAPSSPGAAGEDLYTWFYLFGDLALLQQLHGLYAQDAGRGEQKQQGKVSVHQGY